MDMFKFWVLCLPMTMFLFPGFVIGAEHDLDHTFGTQGVVTTDFFGGNDPGEGVNATLVQPDGKILVAGAVDDVLNGLDFALARYNPDGTLDSTFGDGNGLATLDFGGDDIAYGMTLDTVGQIWIVGTTNGGDFAMARFSPDGHSPTDMTQDFGASSDEEAHGVAVDQNGNIYVVGFTHNGSNYDVAVAAYKPDLTPKNDFGNQGLVITDQWGNEDDQAYAAQIDPVTSQLLVAVASHSFNGLSMGVFRYDAQGNLDPTFALDRPNVGGSVRPGFAYCLTSEIGYGYAIDVEPISGDIFVAGATYIVVEGQNIAENYLIGWFSKDGIPEGPGGEHCEPPDDQALLALNTEARSIDVQDNGNILVAGIVYNGTDKDFFLARHHDPFHLDSSFGDNSSGYVVTDLGNSDDSAYSLAVQSDGKYVVAGSSDLGGTHDFAIVRYIGSINYSVYPSAGTNGSITPNSTQLVPGGDTASFIVAPSPDYKIDTVTGCGGTLNGDTFTTGAIYADCTVTATFILEDFTRTVTPTAGANGNITPSTPQQVLQGTDISFTVTPDPGYEIDTVTGCGGTLNSDIYTTGSIYEHCTVTATFQPILYTVTPSAGANGSIDPSNPQQVPFGDVVGFVLTPDPGYQIYTVSGCDGTLNAEIYITGPINADCSVTAIFGEPKDLRVDVIGNGLVYSTNTADINCSGFCVQAFPYGSVVNLDAIPGTGYYFEGWSLDCTGTGECLLTMDDHKYVHAVFSLLYPDPVQLENEAGSNYTTIQGAYDSVPLGQADRIKVKSGDQAPGDLIFDRDVSIILAGGYDIIFYNIVGDTTFYGSLTIRDGSATVSNLIIK